MDGVDPALPGTEPSPDRAEGRHSPAATAESAASEIMLAPGLVVAWLAVAFVNVVLALRTPIPSIGIRLAHHAYDTGQTLAAGLASAGIVELWRRWGPRSRLLGYLTLALVSAGIGLVVLRDDLDGPADRIAGGANASVALIALCVLVSSGVPAAFAIGRLAVKWGLRLPVALAGVVVIAANGFVLRNGYPGAHLMLTLAGVAAIAAAISGSVVRLPPLSPRLGIGLKLSALALGLWSLLSWPQDRVLADMYRHDGVVVLPWLARLRPDEPTASAKPTKGQAIWFQSRDRRKAVAPSSPALVGDDAIVILITMDAVRPDALEQAVHRGYAPTLHALAETGVSFTKARSFSAGTRFSLGSLFTGRYMSQLPWTKAAHPSLARYKGPRFNELLSKAGVRTVHMIGHTALGKQTAIARGWDESQNFAEPDDRPHPPAAKLIDATIERLKQGHDGRMFFYLHLVDTHSPYFDGTEAGEDFDAYLRAIRYIDRELGKLVGALDALGIRQRTTLIVGSDHGEGFGEHGEVAHDKSLHDTQIRVPLVFSVPGLPARRVQQSVSLIDLAPTILDLFGEPTPGNYMGESLTPFLRGGRTDPTRPLYFERRNSIAMVFPDGLKAIYDGSKGRAEIFDVETDESEELNLRDQLGPKADRMFALLNRYRDVHRQGPKGQ
jgi:arylsulfatase A-like enzyme